MGESVTERGRRALVDGGLRADVVVVLLCALFDIVSTDGDHAWRWGGDPAPWVVPVYCLLGALPLLGRRRYPGIVLAWALCYAWGGVLMHGLMPYFVPLAAAQAYVARRPAAAGRAAVLALAPPNAFNVVDSEEVQEGDFNTVVLNVIAAILLMVGAYLLGRVEQAYRDRAERAENRLAEATEQALAAERRRLARELHDSLGHAITAMTLQAAGARTVAALADGVDSRVPRALGAIEDTGAAAMRDLHRLLGVLRTQGGVAAAEAGAPGLADLDRLVRGARSSGLHVELRCDLPESLDPSVDLAAFRVVQEALSNAMRHEAPGAHVVVHIGQDRARATDVVVRTRGEQAGQPTSPDDAGGFGLSGLRERVQLVGGRLAAGPDGDSFVTRAHFPPRPRSGSPSPRTTAPAPGTAPTSTGRTP